ncbi:MAG: ABC transporter substrate-binding protein [Eubacteriales bacterium]
MLKRIISSCLLLLFLLPFVLSCAADNTQAQATVPSETAVSSTEVVDQRQLVSDDLPEKDFEGYSFRIFTTEDHKKYYIAEEQTGEVVNDAIYAANRAVEERFNIKIVPVISGLTDGKHEEKIKASILAQDDAFDIATGHDITLGNLSLEGYFANLRDMNYLNFEKPWWPSNTVDSLTFMDKMLLFSNSISYMGQAWTRVLFFNKEKMTDLGLTVPYEDVFNGTWTLDKFISLTKDVYTDLNGDGARDKDDFYGFSTTADLYCYLEPFGIEVIKKDGDTLSLDVNNERMRTVVEKFYDLIFDTPGGYKPTAWSGEDSHTELFAKGHALFTYCELGTAVDSFRMTDVSYGILPMPKLDEKQESYYAGNTDRQFVVPVTASDLDRTAIIIEAMSAEGYKKVTPAYYEIALKKKYTYDDESVRILDLINGVRILAFSYIYAPTFNHSLSNLYKKSSPSKDFTSFYEKNEPAMLKRLDEITKKFSEIN